MLKDGVISRDKAKEISPTYVEFIERTENSSAVSGWILDHFYQFPVFRHGQKVLTYCGDTKQFVLAEVVSVLYIGDKGFDYTTGPTVRVGTKEYSWRVDGSSYAVPIYATSWAIGCDS